MCKFPSDTSLDDKLKNVTIQVDGKDIKFFELHPELLPYIGEEFNRTKVLVVGESFYLSEGYAKEETAVKKVMEKWYSTPTKDLVMPSDIKPIWIDFSVKSSAEFISTDKDNNGNWLGWKQAVDKFNTRGICGSQGGGRIIGEYVEQFQDAQKVSNMKDTNLVKYVAFMNYFQRPNIKSESFKAIKGIEKEEYGYAFDIFAQVVEILNPDVILVMSAKIWRWEFDKTFSKDSRREKFVDKLERFYHPGYYRRMQPRRVRDELEKIKKVFEENIVAKF